MARIRTLKPEFWQDEKLGPLPTIDRLVFLGLISQADDAGRLVDSVRLIDGLLFGYTSDSCARSLEVLTDIGVIQRGATASGQRIIQVVNWRHQKIDKPNLRGALPEIAVAEGVTKRRRQVSVKLRAAIYKRDGGKCQQCGTETHLEKGHARYGGDDTLAEIDHILPLADGGSNVHANLQLLCKKCNRKKMGEAARLRNPSKSTTIRRNVGETSAKDPRTIPCTSDLLPATNDLGAADADAPPEPSGRRTRQLPTEWQPNGDHRTLAAGLMHVRLSVEVQKFRDHFTANGKPMKDWDAAFRNWLRRAAEFNGGRGQSGSEASQVRQELPRSTAPRQGADEIPGERLRREDKGRVAGWVGEHRQEAMALEARLREELAKKPGWEDAPAKIVDATIDGQFEATVLALLTPQAVA